MRVSLIYRSIWLYRLLMNILYSLGYAKRFGKVISVIEQYKPASILELCFGDIYIAQYCKENNIKWTGIDVNNAFVNRAKERGFDASCIDLLKEDELPKAEVCVIIGSLYHFHDQTHLLLGRMLKASKIIVISEPVKNLSEQNNWIGYIAKKSANAGKGNEHFRFNEYSLQEMLKREGKFLNFTFKTIDYYKKDIIIVIEKNGSH
jgi:hypothetical protein